MIYVLLNFRKHLRAPACIDPRSSGPYFSGWQRGPAAPGGDPPTALPATWMARAGWRRAGGPLRVEEQPARRVGAAPNLIRRMFQSGAPPKGMAAGRGGAGR